MNFPEHLALLVYSAFAPGDANTNMAKNSPEYKKLSLWDKFKEAISWDEYHNNKIANEQSGFSSFLLRFFLGREAVRKKSLIITLGNEHISLSERIDEEAIKNFEQGKNRMFGYASFYFQNFTKNLGAASKWEGKNSLLQLSRDYTAYLNPFAFLNPLNYWRAFDTALVNMALWCYAYAQGLNVNGNKGNKLWYLPAVILTLAVACTRWPRVLIQFIIGLSVRPLWKCITRYVYNDKPNLLEWSVAIILTAVNCCLLGLPSAIAIGINWVLDTFFNTAVQTLAIEIGVLDTVSQAIQPTAELVSDNILSPLCSEIDKLVGIIGAPNTLEIITTATADATHEEVIDNLANLGVSTGIQQSTAAAKSTILNMYNFYNKSSQKSGTEEIEKNHSNSNTLSNNRISSVIFSN